jgi:hypothetical protein
MLFINIIRLETCLASDRECRTEKFIQQELGYIHPNPCKAKLVELPEQYEHSFSENIILLESKGVYCVTDFMELRDIDLTAFRTSENRNVLSAHKANAKRHCREKQKLGITTVEVSPLASSRGFFAKYLVKWWNVFRQYLAPVRGFLYFFCITSIYFLLNVVFHLSIHSLRLIVRMTIILIIIISFFYVSPWIFNV